MTLRLRAVAVTDVGRSRSGNEDAFLIDDRIGLVAVADGMGGHRGGEVASATALEALRASVTGGTPIRDAIVAANTAVHERARRDDALRGMGTTLTAGTLATGVLLVGHVGDSRAYLLRGGDLRQVTTDHSVVAELVRSGELTAEDAEVDPRRSMITRALGVDAAVDVDVYPVTVAAGDRVLLCSDGLTTMLRDADVAGVLVAEPDPDRAARRLVDAANAAGGLDNITVVVVDVVEDPGPLPGPASGVGPAVGAPADLADPADPGAPGAHPSTATRPVTGPVAGPVADPGAHAAGAPAPSVRRRVAARSWALARWALPIVAVLAVAFGAVAWYARRSYYVGLDRARVTLYQGVPGGLLGWEPTVEVRTRLRTSDVPDAQRDALRDGKRFSSQGAAMDYVDRLRAGARARRTTTTTTTATPAPTTTTVPVGAAPTTAAPGAAPAP